MANEPNIFIKVNALIGEDKLEEAITALVVYAQERIAETVYMDLFESANTLKSQFRNLHSKELRGTHSTQTITVLRNNITERIQKLARFMHNPDLYTDEERSRQKTLAETFDSIYKDAVGKITGFGKKILKIYLIITAVVLIIGIVGISVFYKTVIDPPKEDSKYVIVFDEINIAGTGEITKEPMMMCFTAQIGDDTIVKSSIDDALNSYVKIQRGAPPEYRHIPLNITSSAFTQDQSIELNLRLDKTKDLACSNNSYWKFNGNISVKYNLMNTKANGDKKFTENISSSSGFWRFEVSYHYKLIEK